MTHLYEKLTTLDGWDYYSCQCGASVRYNGEKFETLTEPKDGKPIGRHPFEGGIIDEPNRVKDEKLITGETDFKVEL